MSKIGDNGRDIKWRIIYWQERLKSNKRSFSKWRLDDLGKQSLQKRQIRIFYFILKINHIIKTVQKVSICCKWCGCFQERPVLKKQTKFYPIQIGEPSMDGWILRMDFARKGETIYIHSRNFNNKEQKLRLEGKEAGYRKINSRIDP